MVSSPALYLTAAAPVFASADLILKCQLMIAVRSTSSRLLCPIHPLHPSQIKMSAVIRRGGPVQNAVSGGGMTYTQEICSEFSCSPTGLSLQCVNDLMEGYDMQNATVFMECGGSGYPYYQCIGIEDFSCPSEKPTPTPVPSSGLSDRRVALSEDTCEMFMFDFWAVFLGWILVLLRVEGQNGWT
ncbi:hypothetical protein B0H13DRAFT_1861069 [Mycena leptocephala]|nr:hypothetical protein B0H13DRAFT_1861069 [Mycena leptocephala]